ncbi:alpha/beta fold hydrolase [Phytoactinopolyspora halotolerans]|uniref:Alpha/beta hydrolase n=1 Tax=Phytoactinopolyspora halotolerans TaxID=1981512 RepID=A0A6L9SIU7_9ACTN|nr:alpha/beta hydrolase [Phytoactinopolyspora halotolerans]NEE04598.1 alpha/beta hydrolase [Phytoactinopolyspora halotolerans]
MDHVVVAGLRVAYVRSGAGPPLVLLHGGLSDSRAWSAQIDELSDEFTVVAWDAPGCGQSSDPPEGFGLPEYADCVAGLIDALDLGRPHVLGLSFGGGLALELYRRHPMVPRSLVLASAYAGWAGSLPPQEVERRLNRAVSDAEKPPEEWAASYLPSLFTESASPELLDRVMTMMLDTRPAGMLAMLRGFAEADLRDVLPQIRVPTLLLYGGADQRSPVRVGEDLHAEIPSSRLVVMPGVGHDSAMEAPELFNAEVRGFLRSIRT